MSFDAPFLRVIGGVGYSVWAAACLVLAVLFWQQWRALGQIWRLAGLVSFVCASGYLSGVALLAIYPDGTFDRNITTSLLRSFGVIGGAAAWYGLAIYLREIRRLEKQTRRNHDQ